MPQLTFMQKMADKASRLLPSSFSEIVQDTTSEVLTSPDYENMMFICDQTNHRPDNAKDVVLAIRRRIDSPNPKVQYFTVILLDTLIKNCYEDLHNEVADAPALQNCLVEIAVRTPIRDGEFEAKKAALQLILNMSYWFIGATEDKTKMLSKLADEVRAQTTPLAFEDIEADAAFQLKRAPPARQRVQQRQTQAQAQHAAAYRQGAQSGNRNANPNQSGRRPGSAVRVVDAIPVFQYTGEEISGMLDSCMLLSEIINTAEEEKRSVIGDDIVTSIAVQVRRDHRKLATLLSSGAQMDNLDVLLSVSESQTAIIERLSALVESDGRRLRDVASIGAEEDESGVNLANANRPQARPQITRANPSGSPTVTLGKKQSTRPRQGDIDSDMVEMGDSSSTTNANAAPEVPRATNTTIVSSTSPGGASTASNNTHNADNFFAAPAAAPVARKSADPKGNEQELDDFFGPSGGTPSAAPQGDHNTLYTGPVPATSGSAAAVANTDFFESNNAPAKGAEVSTMGSVNATGGDRDEFDDFLNSRLPK